MSWDKETADWVGKLATTNTVLHDKLAAVGLLPTRSETESTALGTFLEALLPHSDEGQGIHRDCLQSHEAVPN